MVDIKGPIRGFYYPHEAIRVELKDLEDESGELAPEGGERLSGFKDRIEFLEQFFHAHEDGEEASLYPEAAELKEGVSEPFEWDRKRTEEYFDSLSSSVEELAETGKRSALLKLRGDVAALRGFLGTHETKEDEILLPLIDEALNPQGQGRVLGQAMNQFPDEITEDIEKFLVRRITQEDRADFLGIVRQGASQEEFEAVTGWVKEAVSGDEWKDLKSSIGID